MKTELLKSRTLDALNKYRSYERPVNFRPLVSFTVFFIFGILISNKLSALFALFFTLFMLVLCCIAYFNSYKKLTVCMLGFAFGLARIIICNLTDNALNTFLFMCSKPFLELKNTLCDQTYFIFGNKADIINAILWGDTSSVTPYLRNIFSTAGIAHILALSGLHVSFFVSLLCKIIPKHFRKFRLVFCSLFLLAYCAVAAFPPSLMRAAIMTMLYLVASTFFLHHDRPTSIAFAALIILFISPNQIFDLGFQLSFSAIIGILFVCDPIQNFLSRFLPKYISSSAAVTLSATFGVLPVSLYTFSTFPTYTLLGNLLLIPFASFLVISAFLAVVISFVIPPVGTFISTIAGYAYNIIFNVSSKIGTLPFSVFNLNMPFAVSLCIFAFMFVSSQYYMRPAYIKLPVLGVISLLALISCLVI